uniref:PEGA domain protein n=1 Tax=Methanococcus maripaludis (strain C6 / ATCC BAA-1332) TaxID=444158 RepID=A9AAS9_METM6
MFKKSVFILLLCIILNIVSVSAIPHLDAEISDLKIERGSTGKLYVEVEEISGISNAYNITVISEIYDNNIKISPENIEIPIINDGTMIKVSFKVNASKNTKIGEKSGKIFIEYYDFDSENDVYTGPKTVQKEFRYEIIEGHGTYSINSNPKNISVYLNGNYVGNTPLNASIKEGNHFLRLSSDIFGNYSEKITVNAGESSSFFKNFEKTEKIENLENFSENINTSENVSEFSETSKNISFKSILVYFGFFLVALFIIFIIVKNKY